MRRIFSVGAVLLFSWVLGRCQAGAIEYLSGPVFSDITVVIPTEKPVRLSVDPRGDKAFAWRVWVLGAELRDAACPACQFPDFLLPEDFHCIDCPSFDINISRWLPPSGKSIGVRAR